MACANNTYRLLSTPGSEGAFDMAKRKALTGRIDIPLTGGQSIALVEVEGGVFTMGDEVGDLWDPCRPPHPVRLDSYYLGVTPVTQAQWRAVMGDNPSHFRGDNRPVEMVNWNDAQRFIERFNARTGQLFRLPTEAEWEYAARGGARSEGFRYAGSDRLDEVGWYGENSYCETKPVGLKLPNELGLHDMSGNVWEWCHDWLGADYYAACQAQGVVSNPEGPKEGGGRVLRGGSFFDDAVFCRCAHRLHDHPEYRSGYIGFRLALSPSSVG